MKVILFHGVGTNGRQMSMIVGEQLARRGYETIAVDMPEYGMTEVALGALVRYDDWVRAGSDLIDAERAKDDRPIVLTKPAADRWTPRHLSEPFLARVRNVPVKVVMLDNAGHYPLEQPGRAQMVDAIDAFYRDVTAQPARARVPS